MGGASGNSMNTPLKIDHAASSKERRVLTLLVPAWNHPIKLLDVPGFRFRCPRPRRAKGHIIQESTTYSPGW